MGTRLYVGNLAFSVTESSLESFFVERGVKTEKVELVRDVATGRSRGFAFVELSAGQDMDAAIEATNGKEIGGRQLTVNQARERPRGRRGDSHPGGRRGGGGGRSDWRRH
ncbi:MAG: RNA-binding protein [Acidobacteria bacterium]|nr:RNA-binding protein [Acidobacteriota bacterium]